MPELDREMEPPGLDIKLTRDLFPEAFCSAEIYAPGDILQSLCPQPAAVYRSGEVYCRKHDPKPSTRKLSWEC